jgi:hypothetical protein
MDEQQIRVDAALAELQSQITILTHRNINLAGDLAVARNQIAELTKPKPELQAVS